MARNIRVNKWADDLRRNLDAESTGIKVSAYDSLRSKLDGRITVETEGYHIRIDMIGEAHRGMDDHVAIRVIDQDNCDKARSRAARIMASMGYVTRDTGRKVISNVAFNRTDIARLAVKLAA